MSKHTPPNAGLSAMLNAIFGGNVVEITRKPGQSLEEAIAEHEAAHRKECPDCAAEHEAELMQAAAAGGADKQFDPARAAVDKSNKHADEMTKSDKTKDNVAERAEALIGAAAVVVANAGVDHFIVQVPPILSMVKVGDSLYLGDTPKAAREPIGYMAFGVKDGEAIKGSFETDRAVIEKKLATFNALPEIAMLRDLLDTMGARFGKRDARLDATLANVADVEIRPVFGA